MSDYDEAARLPDLSKTQIRLLNRICKRANASSEPPISAIIHAYNAEFERSGLDEAHDSALFRYVLEVANRARPPRFSNEPVDFQPHMAGLLLQKNVHLTGLDTPIADDDPIEAIDDQSEDSHALQIEQAQMPTRRVSFDDAGLEETWISRQSPFKQDSVTDAMPLLSQPPRRPRSTAGPRQKRSASIELDRHPQPSPQQPINTRSATPSTDCSVYHFSIPQAQKFYQPSQTQLEENAEIFFETSYVRMMRRCLQIWRDKTLIVNHERLQAYQIASSHDQRTLLKQSFDTLYAAFDTNRQERRRNLYLEQLYTDHVRRKDRWLLVKAFSHWDESARHQKRATAVAKKHLMKIKYFNRWRKIAVENASKVRVVLIRKFLQLWRDRLSQRQSMQMQASTHADEKMLKKYYQIWFWKFCDRRVVMWHQKSMLHRTLGTWAKQRRLLEGMMTRAEEFQRQYLCRTAIRSLWTVTSTRRLASASAEQHRNEVMKSHALQTLRSFITLSAPARVLSTQRDVNIKRKTIRILQFQYSLSQQAGRVDRRRLLQSTWTAWNESLRCSAVSQRIDERLVLESLYKWVLQERLQRFKRQMDFNIKRRMLLQWQLKMQGLHSKLNQAWSGFQEVRHQLRLKQGMLYLNSALRATEDADRAAVEFRNRQLIPRVFEIWKERTERARTLAKWAADARFYSLCSKTLKDWREKTTEHKHVRRRQAYAIVRARVKTRLVRGAFACLREKVTNVAEMTEFAAARAQSRSHQTAAELFDNWRLRTGRNLELAAGAEALCYRNLAAAALSILVNQHAAATAREKQAMQFLQASTDTATYNLLKKLQWASFTATRRIESADALANRNRDQHVKQMLRHWALLVANRRAARNFQDAQQQEIGSESPSLRPASRAASKTFSAERSRRDVAASPVDLSTTPAYMRTPSRRRTSRFRPLQTPAHVTPMTFDPAYYITNPTPLVGVELPQPQPLSSVSVNQHDLPFRNLPHISTSTQPATNQAQSADESAVFEGLTPQITPFARKLRAGGILPASMPPSALKRSFAGSIRPDARAYPNATAPSLSKSVRFAGSGRFSGRGKGGAA